ncbi:hypothetical protein K492DRAFT_175765 [Lichtheimia hyalospora FSU 10163]|nr:hypothetical protein K492DRAFT_175765 [Lichtheimia hyalospora FSU 10163]
MSGTFYPPRFTRQDAFLKEDTSASDSNSSDDTSLPTQQRRCKICFSMTEPLIKSPCQCRNPPSYIHHTCLIDTLSSVASFKHCCSCHSFYNVNMLSTLQKQPPKDRTSIWKTIMIIVATTLIIETYRCTELQQIPGSELDDHDDEGAHDAIWLPVSDG